MSHPSTVYDLGEIALDETATRSAGIPAARSGRPRPQRAALARPEVEPRWGPPAAVTGTLSLFLPGAGHIVRGAISLGLFFFTGLGLAAALTWALVETLDRSVATLRVLGLPGAWAAWTIAAVVALGAALHVAAVATSVAAGGAGRPPHPVLSGVASLLVPGWGQLLNGARFRASLFVAGLWIVAAAWILSLPTLLGELARLRIYVPDGLLVLCGPYVRWSFPAVLWTLAVYDAATSAHRRRV